MITPEFADYYKDWSAHKDIHISILNGDSVFTTLQNSDLQSDSLFLSQSISDGENIEFVGCVPSRFEIIFYDKNNIASQLKDKKIIVDISVYAGNSDRYTPLFTGYIDDCILQSTPGFFKIVAYDILYKFASMDIYDWYSQLPATLTIYEFRTALFTHLNIPQITTTLINDDVEVRTIGYKITITALDALKAICQLNGVFGRIRRTQSNTSDEIFDYFKLTSSNSVFTIQNNVNRMEVNSYTTAKINQIKIKRVSNDSYEVVVTEPEAANINTYTVQGNLLIRSESSANLRLLAEGLLNQLGQAPIYHPAFITTLGNPTIECGDFVTIQNTYTSISYNLLVLRRELKGIQAIKDSFIAYGEEFQTTIISDLNQQVENLNAQTSDNSDRIAGVEATTQQTTQQVSDLKEAVNQSITVNEMLVESLVTNLTVAALKPRVTNQSGKWRWQDYVVDEQQRITYTPCFSTTNTDKVRNYINIEGTKIKYLTEILTQPADYSKIEENETVYLTVNGKQLYYTDLSTLNSFSTVSPKTFDKTMTAAEEDMYKCRKLKVSSDATWNIEIYSNITTVQGDSLTINKVLGIKFDNNANVEYNSATKVLKTGMIDVSTGKEIASIIKPDTNQDLKFYKRINNHDYEDFIIAKYATNADAIADTDLPDGNFIVITGS